MKKCDSYNINLMSCNYIPVSQKKGKYQNNNFIFYLEQFQMYIINVQIVCDTTENTHVHNN